MNLYQFGILPPPELAEQINEIKMHCAQEFGVKSALNIPVLISLSRYFKEDDKKVQRFVKHLRANARNLFPFDQELENFDSLHTHMIYLRATKNCGLQSISKSLSEVFRKLKIDPLESGSVNMPFKPQVTIAHRDIQPEAFPLMWDEYKNKKFKRSFQVTNFVLMKHGLKTWHPVERFELQAVLQPSLFD